MGIRTNIRNFLRRKHTVRLRNIKRQITGNQNNINYNNSVLSDINFNITGNNNRILIEKGCRISNLTFYFLGDDNQLVIGENCLIESGNFWLEGSGCKLNIGKGTSIVGAHLAVTEQHTEINIGEDCMLAYDIDIRSGDSHSIISTQSGQRINPAKNVVLGNHVWVAAHSIILKGSRIPENSIIATGSVVSGKYKIPGSLIGGNPATLMMSGVNWSRDRL